MFDIRNFIQFDSKGRANCPSCENLGKAHNKNLALVPDTNGAYKCHRGCTPKEIREILGSPKPQQIPTALTPTRPQRSVTVSPQKVKEAADRLQGSRQALPWLMDRGFTTEMIEHYRLGAARAKCGDRHLWAISIPIPVNGGTSFYQKKRIAPWLDKGDRPADYQPWSQYGIPASVFITHQPDEPTQTWLCEGEWDAMRLGWAIRHSELGNNVQVACFTCGAGNVPPDDELARLAPRVISFYDLDAAGENGAQKLANKLGDRCKIARVPAPDEPKTGYDVSDALNDGFTLDNFEAAAAEAKTVEPELIKAYNPLRARLVSNDELIARAPDYVEWLVPDLFTLNELFIVAAPPRGGKSLFALLLAKAIATGEKFLDRPVIQGSVIYVNLEDPDIKIKTRQESQNWSEGLPVYWLDRFKLTEIEYLIELIQEIKPRLVVLDTLSRIRSEGVSEASAEMSLVLEPLQNICKELDVCTLLIHHTRKIEATDATLADVFDTIRGNSAIRGVCRGALIIAPAENSYRLLAENGYGKHDLKMRLDANTLEWRLIGRWNPVVNFDQKEIVLNFLNQVGSATIDQIFAETQIPKRSLYVVLDRLAADEAILKTGQRKSAVYHRPIQQIQQLNSLLNSSNLKQESNRGTNLTKNTFFLSNNAEKVITFPNCHNGESDQQTDHPQSDHLVELGEQSGSKTKPANDSAIQQQFNKESTVELDELGGDHFQLDSETTVTSEKVITPPDQGDHFGGGGDQFHDVGDLSHDETEPPLSVGNLVMPLAIATLFKEGSDKLPWREVPKSLKTVSELPINRLGEKLFHELQQPSKILEISNDGNRIKVISQATGRTAVFGVDGLRFWSGGDTNANG